MRTQENIELDQLAFRFFKMFARFEYALKAAGFHRGDGEAKPNWDDFAKIVNDIFDNTQNKLLKESITYMLHTPPKIQYLRNGLLEWQDRPVKGDTAHKLLLYIRRVRNNLFHGGKFTDSGLPPSVAKS
jgi:hypothetical protein